MGRSSLARARRPGGRGEVKVLAISVALHVLAAIVWVGGMGFAYWYLRPAAGPLDGPVRLGLWQRVFARFFVWVWISVIVLPVTGYVMVWGQWGGLGSMPLPRPSDAGSGLADGGAPFLYLWFVPYRRFKAALAAGDPPPGRGGARPDQADRQDQPSLSG